jgi:hypothetical protein
MGSSAHGHKSRQKKPWALKWLTASAWTQVEANLVGTLQVLRPTTSYVSSVFSKPRKFFPVKILNYISSH